MQNVIAGLEKNNSNDLLAMEIRQALHHLGEIIGEINTDDLLDNIFSKFCPAYGRQAGCPPIGGYWEVNDSVNLG